MLQTAQPDRMFASQFSQRGYAAVYRQGSANQCPGCGRSQWLVGRASAECCFCATALPLQISYENAAAGIHTRDNQPVFFQRTR